MKQYQVKAYTKTLVYKCTVNPSMIMSEIAFNNTINGWQWNMNLSINAEFTDTTFSVSDIIRVYVYDENNSWTLIYSWFVTKINRSQSTNSQQVELELIGLVWLFAWYQVSGVKNEDPAVTIKAFVDWFNSNFWANIFSYDWISVINYWVVTNIDLWHIDCLTAIKKVTGLTNYYRYVWADGKFIFNPKPSTIWHYFTNQKNIESITVQESMEDVVNSLVVVRSWGTSVTYTDAASISAYWKKERYEDKSSEILDVTTQNQYWNNTILMNKGLKKQSKVVLNSKYNIESILPWEIFKIRNFGYVIDDLQIVQTQYRKNNLTLSVEKYTSFWEIVVW